jgi:tetratricopeptide (TPR) repeat protein
MSGTEAKTSPAPAAGASTAPPATARLALGERDWLEWGIQNRRSLTIAAGAVALLAAAVWLYVSSSRRKEAFAQQALAQARASAELGNLPLAASDLARLVERFGGTRAADEGVILLNQIRLIQGQGQIAVTALQEYVRSGRPSYMKSSAYGLLGGGLEDQGKLREAAAAYREAANLARLDFQKAQYLLDAGRALAAAGDSASARAAYGEVLSGFGDLPQSQEARVRMAEVGGEVPASPAGPQSGSRSSSR